MEGRRPQGFQGTMFIWFVPMKTSLTFFSDKPIPMTSIRTFLSPAHNAKNIVHTRLASQTFLEGSFIIWRDQRQSSGCLFPFCRTQTTYVMFFTSATCLTTESVRLNVILTRTVRFFKAVTFIIYFPCCFLHINRLGL